MPMTIEDRKKLCVEYIKFANELRGSLRLDPFGRKCWSRLNAAAIVLVPYANTELRPYSLLIGNIRRKWSIEDSHFNSGLTSRQKYRAGLMSEIDKGRYEYDCRYRRSQEEYRRKADEKWLDKLFPIKHTEPVLHKPELLSVSSEVDDWNEATKLL